MSHRGKKKRAAQQRARAKNKLFVPEWKKKIIAKKREVSDFAKARKIDEPIEQFFAGERPFWATD